MPVYFAKAGEFPFIKIGYSEGDLDARVRDLQTANFAEIHLLRVCDGHYETERWFHRHFAKQRIRNEWFHEVPEMMTVRPPFEFSEYDERVLVKWSREDTLRRADLVHLICDVAHRLEQAGVRRFGKVALSLSQSSKTPAATLHAKLLELVRQHRRTIGEYWPQALCDDGKLDVEGLAERNVALLQELAA